MRDKLERMDQLLEAGFHLETITSDDHELRIELRQGPTRLTFRIDREEVRAHWPDLFPGDDEAVHAAPATGPMTRTVAAHPGLSVEPYGAAEVREFLRRDDLDRVLGP